MSFAITKKESTFGATLMVTGCCIGAGMIGLPVVSAAAGFLPSLLAICFSYAFTTATGLLLLEATLWFEGRVNLMSIAQSTLGRFGKILVALLFSFLFYAIFVSYLDGGGQILSSWLGVAQEVGILLCFVSVAAILHTGVVGVDRVNRILMAGLVVSYCLIAVIGSSQVKLQNLLSSNWTATLATLPILFISFGYHNLVPGLVHYLRRNVASIRFAIMIGNLIPLFLYSLWNFVILGMIEDPHLLNYKSGLVIEMLTSASPSVVGWVNAFSFFALFTSFITVGLSFMDFMRDGFKKPPNDWVIQAIVLGPPLLISFLSPNLFLKALGFAGGVIVVILYGILPVLIVYIGRYRKGYQGPYQIGGGKLFLSCMGLASLFFLLLWLV